MYLIHKVLSKMGLKKKSFLLGKIVLGSRFFVEIYRHASTVNPYYRVTIAYMIF
ncbi:MAG TPA: hypothetical protein PLH80_03205 [Spirochaetota bacterium]|nr:hypothetical protein [Spirochaetota bacterium]HOM88189.1 hypothetical protein [Spirochaetota bacterium]HOR94700.1 hypothetical protein [Spirochaetota bacterium]HPD05680.1 hypothetical protein [Spirochaetota bacterium]HQG43444.1 hypothetical protein [Spirochaetota bacterium]